MAAGLGFKDFSTGEVLTAADVDGYLMQGIWVFASTAARDASVTSPSEGNFAFTKDTNSLWYYDGAAWVASGATGDIEGVTAGIGISGGGTSGTVTVTNSMATAIDAKGDLVAGTGADTFAKLTVGANDTILTADSSAATGLKWATPAGGGGMTLLSTTTLSGATTTVSSIDQTYKDLLVIVQGVNKSAAHRLNINPNSVSNLTSGTYSATTSAGAFVGSAMVGSGINLCPQNFALNGNTDNAWVVQLYNYASSSFMKPFSVSGTMVDDTSANAAVNGGGGFRSTTAISSLQFDAVSGTFNAGTVLIYGVK